MSQESPQSPPESEPSDPVAKKRGLWRRKANRAEQGQEVLSDYNRYGTVGIQFAAGLTVFCLGGLWLDQKIGTSPLFLIIGLLAGFGGGLASLLYRFPLSQKAKAKRNTPPDSP